MEINTKYLEFSVAYCSVVKYDSVLGLIAASNDELYSTLLYNLRSLTTVR